MTIGHLCLPSPQRTGHRISGRPIHSVLTYFKLISQARIFLIFSKAPTCLPQKIFHFYQLLPLSLKHNFPVRQCTSPFLLTFPEVMLWPWPHIVPWQGPDLPTLSLEFECKSSRAESVFITFNCSSSFTADLAQGNVHSDSHVSACWPNDPSPTGAIPRVGLKPLVWACESQLVKYAEFCEWVVKPLVN